MSRFWIDLRLCLLYGLLPNQILTNNFFFAEFAQALTNITHAMDHFHITGTYPQLNHQQPAPQPTQYGTRPDELSLVLGMMSQRLRSLELHEVAVSDDLFLQHNPIPASPGMTTAPAHWARLENLGLYYPPVTPSGERLFYPDPSDPGRRVASPALQQRYLAAARAALEMPLLKDLMLIAQLELEEEGEEDWHKFWYHCGAKTEAPIARWTSSTGFVPDDEVQAAWRDVARRYRHGKELEIDIMEDDHAV
jgi:hypothetical protein